MKNNLLSRLILGALTVAAPLAQAHPEPDFEFEPPPAPLPAQEAPKVQGHEHHTNLPATAGEIWSAIELQQKKLADTLSDRKLADAHDYAFAIRDLAKGLLAKLPAEQQAAATDVVANIAAIAGDIEKSAAAGAQRTTEGNVADLNAAVKTLRARTAR